MSKSQGTKMQHYKPVFNTTGKILTSYRRTVRTPTGTTMTTDVTAVATASLVENTYK